MSRLPTSFDPYLLEDQLLAALKQSPHTSQLVPLRAEEIIQIILEKPIIQNFQQQVRDLKNKLSQQKELKRTIRSTSKKQYRQQEQQFSEKNQIIQKLNKEVQVYVSNIQALELQNQELQRQMEEYQLKMDGMSSDVEQLSRDNERISKQLQQVIRSRDELASQLQIQNNKLIKLNEEQSKYNNQHHSVVNQLQIQLIRNKQESTKQLQAQVKVLHETQYNNQIQVQERDKTIELLKEERFALKNQINGFKIDLQQLTKELELLKQQNTNLLVEKDKLKQTVKTNKLIFDKERKMINTRLYQLTLTYKAHQKLKVSTNVICKSMAKLQKQYSQLATWIAQQLNILKIEGQDNTKIMLDQVGRQVQRQVTILRDKLQSRGQEVRGAKSESKHREQALQRSQRQLEANAKQISDLRGQIRLRRRQEQRLRRELKTSYQQSELRLAAMQKKYLQLLGKGGY